jgi:hypothetical protein
MANDFLRIIRSCVFSLDWRRCLFLLAMVTTFPVSLTPLDLRAQPAQPLTRTEKTWTLTDKDRIQGLIAQGQAQQALAELLLFGSSPYGQVEFDYLLGVAALEAGQYSLALESLERVVLMNPQHAGAWLDLAMVHYRMKDYEAAKLLTEHVENHFKPNQQLKAQLQLLRKQLIWAPYTKDWYMELSSHIGYVKNANSGLNDLNFSLTPVGGLPIRVQVDGTQSPRSDTALLIRANAYRLINHGAQSYSEVLLSLGTRQYATEKEYGMSDLSAMWLYTQAWKGMEWQLGPSLREIMVGDSSIGEIYGAQASLWQGWNECRLAPRIELEHRQYRESGYYDSLTPWLGAVARCEKTTLTYGFSVRTGMDQAKADRPGGDTLKTEYAVYGRYRINPNWTFDLSVAYSDYKDQDSYSSLIANGANRKIDRWLGRMGVEWHAKDWGYKNLYVNTYFDSYKEKSNIVFSNTKDKQLFVGLRYVLGH